jgi:hypothetical protein
VIQFHTSALAQAAFARFPSQTVPIGPHFYPIVLRDLDSASNDGIGGLESVKKNRQLFVGNVDQSLNYAEVLQAMQTLCGQYGEVKYCESLVYVFFIWFVSLFSLQFLFSLPGHVVGPENWPATSLQFARLLLHHVSLACFGVRVLDYPHCLEHSRYATTTVSMRFIILILVLFFKIESNCLLIA